MPDNESLPAFIAEDAEASAPAEDRTRDTTRVEQAIKAALELESEIEDHEQAIKGLKKKLQNIMWDTLPEFMTEVGLKEFGTADGSRVKLGPNALGSLNKAPDMEEAVRYLEENGLKGGVLTELTIRFTEDERDQIPIAANSMHDLSGKDVLVKRSIPAPTLRSFVHKKVEEDPHFDASIVGMTVTTAAKFTKRGKS